MLRKIAGAFDGQLFHPADVALNCARVESSLEATSTSTAKLENLNSSLRLCRPASHSGVTWLTEFALREHASIKILSIFLLGLVYLYLVLFIPPWIPRYVGFADGQLFLSEATRILHGQVIYRDFFDLNFPGLPIFYASLIRMFGPRAWIANASLVCLGIGFLWTSTVISKRLVNGATVFLPGLLFLCIPFHNYLDASHHWYSTLLIMVAAAVLIKRFSYTRLALAGGLSGLAAMFSQNEGPVAVFGLAAFVWIQAGSDGSSKRDRLLLEGCLLLSFAMILGACAVYFIIEAGPERFFNSTVLFPLKYWAATNDPNSWSDYAVMFIIYMLSHGYFLILRPVIITILIPWIYIPAIVLYKRRSPDAACSQWRVILLLSAVGVSLFASVANAADITRLCAVSLPGFIILVWLADRGKWGRKAMPLLWAFTIVIMLKDISTAQKSRMYRVETPSGSVALYSADREPYFRWLGRHTSPGQYVFDAASSDVYFLFGLENPTEVWWLTSCDFTRPEQVSSVLRSLQDHQVRFILWDSEIDTTVVDCLPATDHIQPIRDYLHRHYRKIETFQDDTIWERISDSH